MLNYDKVGEARKQPPTDFRYRISLHFALHALRLTREAAEFGGTACFLAFNGDRYNAGFVDQKCDIRLA